MPYNMNPFLILTATVSITSIICASLSWSKISLLSLPISGVLPAINILIPLLTALSIPLSTRLILHHHQQGATTKPGLSYHLRQFLSYLSTLPPVILLILSLLYAMPGDIQTCSLQNHWLRMFEAKNDRAIRTIQTTLQCCGLNSIHDRAWPFPARGVDARACERTQGYTVPCRGRWTNEERFAATLTAVASFLNWIVVILTVVNAAQRDEGRIRLPAWSTSTRLIEDGMNGEENGSARVTEEDGQSGGNRPIGADEGQERPEQQQVWERP